MPIIEHVINDFPNGIINTIDSKDIPEGAASASLNWMTFGDRIELRRGQIVVGTETATSGKITGLFTAYRADGTAVVFRKNGQKLQYFIAGTSSDWSETGSNIFPAAAANDFASFADYSPPAGNMLFVSSPNSSIYKIMLANPGNYINLADSTQNFSGKFRMKIGQGPRMFAWNRVSDKVGTISDPTGVYMSYIDAQKYTLLNNEVLAVGDGSTKTFSGTLNCKNNDPKSTAMLLKISAPTGAAKNITAITRATTAQITAASHGYSIGDTVIVSGLTASNAGTGSISSNNGYGATVVGSGTAFLSQLSVGTTVFANTYTFSNPARVQAVGIVGSIIDDTHFTWQGFSYIDAGTGTFTFTNMNEIVNQPLTVAGVVDANNFTVNINSTNFHPYANGGTVTKTETIVDDYNGNLTGNSSATGTVNYTTGAYSFTLQNAATNAVNILCTYQYENPNNNGITDFTKSNPRTSGQGAIIRQDEDGLTTQNILTYAGHEFCFHTLRTWDLQFPSNDDTTVTNEPYRSRIGLTNYTNGLATSTGVYYINDIDKNNIKLERLELNRYMGVLPHVLSKNPNKEGEILGVVLDGFVFDQTFMWEFGDLILIACRNSTSPTNDTTITFNKLTNAIDYLDYTVNCMTTVGSELWAGDSVSPNVYKILNGFDDGGANINNSWESKNSILDNLYIKRIRRLVIQGVISTSQSFNVYGAPDDGDYVFIGTISGTGSYVDRTQGVSVTVGYGSVGSNMVGGETNNITAYNYEHALKLPFNRFVKVKIKYQATGSGYLSVSRVRWHDILAKYLRILTKYK